jgi:hypothetical protein
MKFALISNVLTPSETAHAAIIERLLRILILTSTYCFLRGYYEADQSPWFSERLARYYDLEETYHLTGATASDWSRCVTG